MISFKLHNPNGDLQPRFLEQTLLHPLERPKLCLEDLIGSWHGKQLPKLLTRYN